ncbi:uncharacterized protein MELLADRAFT_114869 [Melampsora larici-populina 98AG31]|uniref:Adenylate kinase active site lid domain-containing protein n=1 Tax=Melampsora larici-populina (strain 98AG31 / pathotype 3-4-7) TaxID=747676 RepID=F4R3U2_MELLP|nr:uncharacterized protein MELLADRAFT_114869 [Melampsora larici-populina 98AG31]EGG12685.1 hypothetical protein MELLADRAFT_114869 [Melampsora larici-populina 98AG31]
MPSFAELGHQVGIEHELLNLVEPNHTKHTASDFDQLTVQKTIRFQEYQGTHFKVMIRLGSTQLSRTLPSISIGTDAFRVSHLNQVPSLSRLFHDVRTQHQALTSNGRMRMIMLGPPGSGKGTHCSKLISTFNPSLIGTGDLLRWNVNNHTELGKLAENYISRGDLLPDDVILELVKPELRQLADRDWILDGFPRTRAQAIKLDKFLKEELKDELNVIIALHVPDDIILHRISGRWIHGPSGRVYNTTYNPPKVEGLDDVTGDPLIKRKDDTVEVFANRLNSFHEENEPMLNYYEYQTFLKSSSASQEPSTTDKCKKLIHLSGHTSDDIWPQIYEHVQERMSSHTSILADEVRGSQSIPNNRTKSSYLEKCFDRIVEVLNLKVQEVLLFCYWSELVYNTKKYVSMGGLTDKRELLLLQNDCVKGSNQRI